MIRNYFIVAWRNLVKHKAHSFLNLAGLSVGIACSLLIFLWVRHEYSVDAYHRNGTRLYKVYEREYYSNNIDGNYEMPGLLAEELKKVIPEIEDAAMMQDENHEANLRAGNKILKVEGTGASAGLFSMFSYPLLKGTAAGALASKVNIAISAKTAGQFFGSPENAMGRFIRFNNTKDYIVAAVFEDLPDNASRKFDYVISWEARLEDRPWLGPGKTAVRSHLFC